MSVEEMGSYDYQPARKGSSDKAERGLVYEAISILTQVALWCTAAPAFTGVMAALVYKSFVFGWGLF